MRSLLRRAYCGGAPSPCGTPPRGPRRRTVGAPPTAPATSPRHAAGMPIPRPARGFIPPLGLAHRAPGWMPPADAGRGRVHARVLAPQAMGVGGRSRSLPRGFGRRYDGSAVLSPRAHSAAAAAAIAAETGATPPRPRSVAVALRDEPRPESAPGCRAWPLYC